MLNAHFNCPTINAIQSIDSHWIFKENWLCFISFQVVEMKKKYLIKVIVKCLHRLQAIRKAECEYSLLELIVIYI